MMGTLEIDIDGLLNVMNGIVPHGDLHIVVLNVVISRKKTEKPCHKDQGNQEETLHRQDQNWTLTFCLSASATSRYVILENLPPKRPTIRDVGKVSILVLNVLTTPL